MTWEEFDALGPRLESFFETAANLLKVEIARRLFYVQTVLWPVGDPRKDSHPGKGRASTTVSLDEPRPVVLPNQAGYPIPGALEFEAGIAGVTFAQPIYEVNAAADRPGTDGYAWVINRGRVRGRTFPNRWYGSLAASLGILHPAVQEVNDQRATVVSATLGELRALTP
jgi:hypothetical protein